MTREDARSEPTRAVGRSPAEADEDLERTVDAYLRAIDPRLKPLDEDQLVQLEERFIRVAKLYADRRGISRAAWRVAGVSPSVLERAGIAR